MTKSKRNGEHIPPTQPDNLTGRLQRRLLLYSAGALLVLAVGVGAASVSPLFQRLKQAEESGLNHIAETRAMAVGEWFRRAKDLARQVTSRTRIRQELEAYNAGKRSLAQLTVFSKPKLTDAMNLSEEVVGITRLDKAGQPVASVGVPIPLSGTTGFKYGPEGVSASPPLVLGKNTCIIIAAPIMNRQSVKVGTDLVAVDISILQDIVCKTDGIRGGGMVRLGYLSEGRVRMFPNPSGKVQQPQGRGCMRRALAGESGVLTPGEIVSAFTPVKGSNWGLTVTVDEEKLYAPVRSRLLTFLGYTVVIYLLCLAGFWVLLRPLTGKLLFHATELESEIESKTVSLQSELKARQKAEKALQEAHQKLEVRVQERTQELARANQALQKVHEKLEAEHDQRKILSKKLINLLEEVRMDVARELHDHTGQLLTTLRLDLQSALEKTPPSSESCRVHLQSAAEKINQVQRDIKSISKGLRPDTLEYLGLVPALEALLDEYRVSSDLKLYFFHNEGPQRLDGQRELALYRVAQEALTNALKHAQARRVHVNLVFRTDSLTLTVEDDGIGFDPAGMADSAKVTSGLGLTLMKERIVQLGGSLNIESAQGQGTQILAELKL